MAFDLVPGPGGSRFGSLGRDAAVAGGRLVFPAHVPGYGEELVVTDGTIAGTDVMDLLPGPNSSDPGAPTAAGSRLFFAAADHERGRELWILDLPIFRDGFESGDLSGWNYTRTCRERREVQAWVSFSQEM